mmetsp:Transcript_4295/g.11788  ORF Transcript_4295/g.11788 Transcript_4295/m.11788 type:complete len:205 (+) Transcript_4295:296-910(+)
MTTARVARSSACVRSWSPPRLRMQTAKGRLPDTRLRSRGFEASSRRRSRRGSKVLRRLRPGRAPVRACAASCTTPSRQFSAARWWPRTTATLLRAHSMSFRQLPRCTARHWQSERRCWRASCTNSTSPSRPRSTKRWLCLSRRRWSEACSVSSWRPSRQSCAPRMCCRSGAPCWMPCGVSSRRPSRRRSGASRRLPTARHRSGA